MYLKSTLFSVPTDYSGKIFLTLLNEIFVFFQNDVKCYVGITKTGSWLHNCGKLIFIWYYTTIHTEEKEKPKVTVIYQKKKIYMGLGNICKVHIAGILASTGLTICCNWFPAP